MLQIVKASAGSGKTTRLSETYIDMLVRSKDPREYRHILAVTFTNKATAEMKEKILEKLYEGGHDAILHAILHDYGNFAVSTIDSFFQRTLRAFAHETGHYSSSQIELSKDSLIEEAVDSILDDLDENVQEDGVLLDYITENVVREVEAGNRINIDEALKGMAKELRSETFWQKSHELGFDVQKEYTPERLKYIRNLVYSVATTYVKTLVAKAGDIVDAAASIGLEPADFKGGQNSWFNGFVKVAGQKISVNFLGLTNAQIRSAQNPDNWFTKANAGNMERAIAVLGPKMDDYLKYFQSNRFSYVTSVLVYKNLYGLAIAEKLECAFDRIAQERNVICLDESNRLLKDIIDGSDAPFVYEKTGTYIGHYFLDEFQDTSTTQWANFKPLLQEADANDRDEKEISNLIVGDVKQSIYRWRESDWSLMQSKVDEEFPRAKHDELKKNFRSCEEIVKFNSDFYPVIAARLDERCNTGTYIQDIYSDVEQVLGKEQMQAGKGYVEVRFCEDRENELNSVVQIVRRETQENGARPCDITILVRNNEKGSLIASRLVEEGFRVETEASFALISSLSVRRLVSMLSYVNNPGDKLNAYVAEKMEVESFPTGYHDLIGLCDDLAAILKKNEQYASDFAGEIVFITAFMDYVRDFASSNGNNLGEFLKYWEEKNSSSSMPCISSSLSSDSVKIMSIHKSKGLSAPYVIVPFVEDIKLYNTNKTTAWCAPVGLEGGDMEPLAGKLFKIPLTDLSGESAFAGDYAEEYKNQSVDAINLMYVATTRARLGMSIITSKPRQYSNDSFWAPMNEYFGGTDMQTGKPCDYSSLIGGVKEDGPTPIPCPMEYEVFPLAGRLGIRPYAEDYFNPDNNEYGKLRPTARGIVLHDILSRVTVPSDLDNAVKCSVENGSLAIGDFNDVYGMLERAIKSHPEFFPQDPSGKLPAGYMIYKETPIICSDGSQIRPDRVVVAPDSSVTIIDFKFGKDSESYTEQIRNYSDAFKKMGYATVQTKLWFVFKNFLR